eukprot:754327-Hanusia_phi.AAC.1
MRADSGGAGKVHDTVLDLMTVIHTRHSETLHCRIGTKACDSNHSSILSLTRPNDALNDFEASAEGLLAAIYLRQAPAG